MNMGHIIVVGSAFFLLSFYVLGVCSLRIEAFPYQTGWPKQLSGDIKYSPVIADVDGDGTNEVIVTLFDPYSVHVLKYDGTYLTPEWPKTFSNIGGSPPSVADLDNDGDLEIIADGMYLYAWHHSGDFVAGFPTTTMDGFIYAAPAVGDITGDGLPEIAAGNYDCEFYVWDNQGNVLPGFPKIFEPIPGSGCDVMYAAAMGDIDLDGINEVIVPVINHHIYAYNADGSIVSGIWDIMPDYGNASSDITVGDIDNDGTLEVLFITHSSNGGYYPVALNHDTTPVWGWPPCNIKNPTTAGLVMGDMDRDGKLEVVTGTANNMTPATLYIWEGESGQIKKGWPVTISTCSFSRNILLGDINGDGSTDILGIMECNFTDGKIYAFSLGGNILSGFPIEISGYGTHFGTGFITDLDNDGDVEIGVCVGDTYQHSQIMIWDLPYPYRGKSMPWPQDRHDPAHTNNYHWQNPPPQVPTLRIFSLISIMIVLSFLILTKAVHHKNADLPGIFRARKECTQLFKNKEIHP